MATTATSLAMEENHKEDEEKRRDSDRGDRPRSRSRIQKRAEGSSRNDDDLKRSEHSSSSRRRRRETEEERAERKRRERDRGKEDRDKGKDKEGIDSKDPYGLSGHSKKSSDDHPRKSDHSSSRSRSRSSRHLSSRDKERSSRHLKDDERRSRSRRETSKERRIRKEKERARDKDGRSTRDRGRTHADKSPRRSNRRKETEEERAERKKREKEGYEKEKKERREKGREERRKKDKEEGEDKEREAPRDERRKEQESKIGTKQNSSLQVNRADLRSKNTEPFSNVYKLGKLIYESDGCKVHVCHHTATGTERAVKITPKKLRSYHEFDMLKQVDHPNILTMYDLFDEEGPNGCEFYLVMDLCKGGTLHRLLMKKLGKDVDDEQKDDEEEENNNNNNGGRFGLGGLVSAFMSNQDEKEEEEEEEQIEPDGRGLDEAIVKKIMFQLLSCVNYLHKNKLIHADLKPHNILLPSPGDFGAIKVIDFDNSILLRRPDDKVNTKNGTPEYMAPEVHAGQKYDYKCDIWSCGVIAYQLLSNTLPFGDTEEIGEDEVRKRVREGTFKLEGPTWSTVTQEARDFVKSLLVARERKRPTAEKTLVHPWIAAVESEAQDGQPAALISLNNNMSAMMAMSNFRKFNTDTNLKKAACSFIASQLLTKEEKDKIDAIFRAMDITKDGKLSKTEVKAGFFQVFGTFLPDAEIDEIFDRVDCDGTGEIEYSEFVIASMAESDLLSPERLKKAFQLFDKDNNGSITIGELREIFSFFQTAGAAIDDAYIKSAIAAVDSDGNGVVSFDEFVGMMTSGVH